MKLIEYDIEKNEAKKAEMKKLTGGSSMVPVIDVEGIVIRGYAADEIQQAVETKRKGSR